MPAFAAGTLVSSRPLARTSPIVKGTPVPAAVPTGMGLNGGRCTVKAVTIGDGVQLREALEHRRHRLARALRGCAAAALCGLLLSLAALQEERLPQPLALGFFVTFGGLAALGAALLRRGFARLAAAVPRLKPAPCRLLLHITHWIDGADYAGEVRIAELWRLRVRFDPPERDLGPLDGHELDAVAWMEPQCRRLWAVELPMTVLWVSLQVRVAEELRA